MIKFFLLNGVLVLHPIEPYEPPFQIEHVCSLTDHERDVIFRQCEWATYRSLDCLEECETILSSLTEFNGKKACKAALQAAITSLAGASSKERIVIAVISVLAKYLDDAADALWDCYYLALDSKAYAKKADALEERLWLDK